MRAVGDRTACYTGRRRESHALGSAAMGEVFAGRYELIDPVAQGGMGTIWRVRDQRDGQVLLQHPYTALRLRDWRLLGCPRLSPCLHWHVPCAMCRVLVAMSSKNALNAVPLRPAARDNAHLRAIVVK